MKKRILFAAYTLDVGGIETALVDLLNELVNKYDITLVLEKKQGIFLNSIDKQVNIIEYSPNHNKNIIVRKLINVLKRIKFMIRYKNRFDFSASFTTYSKMSSFCARTASSNNALWIHTDYWSFFNKDTKKMLEFFNFISLNRFKNIVTVSEAAKNNLLEHFPTIKNKKVICINNVINYKKIIDKSKEKIEYKKNQNEIVFLNVARHDENSKKISRLINVAKVLKSKNFKFKIFLIGSGPDTGRYKEMVNKEKLQSYIFFIGEIKNPYPFFKLADALVLTSDFEGYPVVYNEAKILNLPIITTDVSDSLIDIKNKFGIVTSKNEQDICLAMEKFIENGFIIKETFDAQRFNNMNIDKVKNMIEKHENL